MGKPLEAAMLIGTPPTAFLTAASPLPYDVDEMDVAAKLAGAPIPMRKCKHVDLEVPADTEVVIEGRFLPNERRPEGPFGEFMGYYVPVGNNAVFEVLGVTVRKDAVFHSILCGSASATLSVDGGRQYLPEAECRAARHIDVCSPSSCTPWSRSRSNKKAARQVCWR